MELQVMVCYSPAEVIRDIIRDIGLAFSYGSNHMLKMWTSEIKRT